MKTRLVIISISNSIVDSVMMNVIAAMIVWDIFLCIFFYRDGRSWFTCSNDFRKLLNCVYKNKNHKVYHIYRLKSRHSGFASYRESNKFHTTPAWNIHFHKGTPVLYNTTHSQSRDPVHYIAPKHNIAIILRLTFGLPMFNCNKPVGQLAKNQYLISHSSRLFRELWNHSFRMLEAAEYRVNWQNLEKNNVNKQENHEWSDIGHFIRNTTGLFPVSCLIYVSTFMVILYICQAFSRNTAKYFTGNKTITSLDGGSWFTLTTGMLIYAP